MPAPPNGRRPGKPPAPRRAEITDQLEPVDEATQYRRRIDDTIARFSAAHDELEAEEAERKERRSRITAGPARLIEQTRTRLQRVISDDDPQQSAATGAAGTDSSHAAESSRDEDSRRDDEEPPTTARARRDRSRLMRRVARALRISACVLAVLVFVGTASAWGATEWFNAQFNEVAALDTDSDDIHDGAVQVNDENFLVVGPTRGRVSHPETVSAMPRTSAALVRTA